MPYFCFNHYRQMFQALYAACGDGFPDTLWKLPGERYAVELDPHASRIVLDLHQGMGWQLCQPDKQDAQQAVPFPSSALTPARWSRYDPVRQRYEQADATADGRGSTLEGIRYILAADDEAQGQRLSDLLVRARVPGLHALSPLPEAPARAPYRHFWAVTGGAPPLEAARTASRVWTRLEQENPPLVFQQWPWRMDPGSARLLTRIHQDGGRRLVLLGREPPRLLFLQLDDAAMRPVTALSELWPGDPGGPLTYRSDPAPAPRFGVRLSLLPPYRQPGLGQRVRRLEEEIESKSLLLEQLREQLPDDTQGDWKPRRHLYAYQEPAPGRVPHELRRLLVEWPDRMMEQGGLCYQKVRGRLRPDEPERALHLLTTEGALGRGGPADHWPDLLLQAYAPPGELQRLELLPEWSRFGLRLFIPAGLGLSFHPELPPREEVAERLKRELLPGLDAAEYALLLLPDRDGHALPFRVARAGFRPFVHSFEWGCELQQPAQELESEQLAAEAGAAAAQAIATRLEEELRRLATAEIERAAGLTESLAELSGRLRGAEAWPDWTALEQEVARTADGLQGLDTALRGRWGLPGAGARLREQARTLAALAERLERLEQGHDKRLRRHEGLARRMAGLRRRLTGSGEDHE